jgi:hypothetical protein
VRSAPWTEGRRISEEDLSRLAKLRGTQVVRDSLGQPFALFEGRYRLEDAAKELGWDAEARIWGRAQGKPERERNGARRELPA